MSEDSESSSGIDDYKVSEELYYNDDSNLCLLNNSSKNKIKSLIYNKKCSKLLKRKQ